MTKASYGATHRVVFTVLYFNKCQHVTFSYYDVKLTTFTKKLHAIKLQPSCCICCQAMSSAQEPTLVKLITIILGPQALCQT